MKCLILCFLPLFISTAFAQVSINTTGAAPAANTMLDIKSTSRGVQFPRMTAAQRNAITVSAADMGLMVFDTDAQSLFMFDGTQWLAFASAAPGVASMKERTAGNIALNAKLGSSTAMDGDYAAAGAPYDSVAGKSLQGSVIVYQKQAGQWVQQAKITANDGMASDFFGYSVSLSGNTLAVGAVSASVGGIKQGAVYMYTRSGNDWIFQQKVFANDGAASNLFGFKVLLYQNSLYVGSPNHAWNGAYNQGSVYVYNLAGNVWTGITQVNPAVAIPEAYFGASLAMHGNTLVVGAPRANTYNTDDGAAYAFIRSGNSFSQQYKFTFHNQDYGYFGNAVAIENNLVVVSCPNGGSVVSTNPRGFVATYLRTGASWTQTDNDGPQGIKAEDREFGTDLVLINGNLLVSAKNESVDGATNHGWLYWYKVASNEIYPHQRFTQVQSTASPLLGSSIASNGTDLVIGVPGAIPFISSSISKGKVLFTKLE